MTESYDARQCRAISELRAALSEQADETHRMIAAGNDLADSIEELRAVMTEERIGRWQRASTRVAAWRALPGCCDRPEGEGDSND